MNKKIKQRWHTIRVSDEAKSLCDRILKRANQKKIGNKIKSHEILKLGLNLIKEADIKKLQSASLSNEDRKEKLRQIYVKKVGRITKDQFTGFMMKPDFLIFLDEHSEEVSI